MPEYIRCLCVPSEPALLASLGGCTGDLNNTQHTLAIGGGWKDCDTGEGCDLGLRHSSAPIYGTLAKSRPFGDPFPISKGEGKFLTLDTFPALVIPQILPRVTCCLV